MFLVGGFGMVSITYLEMIVECSVCGTPFTIILNDYDGLSQEPMFLECYHCDTKYFYRYEISDTWDVVYERHI